MTGAFARSAVLASLAPGARDQRIEGGHRMDLSTLDQDEKLALSAAIVVFLAGLLSNWGGLLLFSILAALGVAAVVLLPHASPGTSLPGSRGSLLAGFGFIALGAAAIELVRDFGDTVDTLGRFGTLLFIVALIGSAIMSWAGWQALQHEGGKWHFGMDTATTASADTEVDEAESPPTPDA